MRLRVLAGLIAVVGALSGPAASVPAEEPPIRVAILPVVIRSVEEDSSYLREGLSDMLASRLAREKGVGVIRVNEPEHATVKLGPARAIGQKVGADFVLFGSFTQFGDAASLDLQCAEVVASRGEDALARQLFIQSGTVGEIIPELDGLSARMGTFLRDPETSLAEVDPAVSSAPPGAGGAGGNPALLRRLEALETAVFGISQTQVIEEADDTLEPEILDEDVSRNDDELR